MCRRPTEVDVMMWYVLAEGGGAFVLILKVLAIVYVAGLIGKVLK